MSNKNRGRTVAKHELNLKLLCENSPPEGRGSLINYGISTYLRQPRDATELLGELIRLGRKERKMTEEELSGRAGISRRTLQKIERGDPMCEIDLVFEVANIVGVKLFNDEENSIRYTFGRHIDDKLALLPKRVRKTVKVNDDF